MSLQIEIGTWGMRGFELIAEGRSIAIIKYGKLKTAETIRNSYLDGRREIPAHGLRDIHNAPGRVEIQRFAAVDKRHA